MNMKAIGMVCVGALCACAAAAGLTGTMSAPLLVAGSGRAYVLMPDGRIAWEAKGCGNIHRVERHGGWVYYSNADLWRVDVATGRRELVYRPCPTDGLFGFEIQPNGNVVVAENGTGYVTELAAGTTNAVVKFRGDARLANGTLPGLHNRYRMIRKTPAGTYLVCCSSANVVREYDATGREIWSQTTPRRTSGHAPLAFDALRRANGNTLISHLGGITEFTPAHEAVWSVTCADLPELKLDNLCGIQELPNGNLVVGTYANGRPDGSRTTAFEITRDKKVVWSYAPTGDRNMMTAFIVPGWSK